MPLQGLCIELRPNLASGRMILQFDEEIGCGRSLRLMLRQGDVHLVEQDEDSDESTILLRHDAFGMNIHQISYFVASGCTISFRFRFTHIDWEEVKEIGANSRGNRDGRAITEMQPLELTFKENGGPVALNCSKCNNTLVNARNYRRLREFPTGLMDPCEFFCHSHSALATPTTLVPGLRDLFYSLNAIILKKSVLKGAIIKNNNSIYCKRCMYFIGSVILSGAAAKIWGEALRWVTPIPSTLTSIPPIARNVFEHGTVSHFMLRLLETLWPRTTTIFNPDTSRVLLIAVMPNGHSHYMLIQVSEPHLATLRGFPATADGELCYYHACKLYFRVVGSCQREQVSLVQWSNMDVPNISISPYVFVELQKRLERNAIFVPQDWRFNNAEEQLRLTYFFYETEYQEFCENEKYKSAEPIAEVQQESPQPMAEEEYETDDADDDGDTSVEDDNESEDTDSDEQPTSSLLSKSTPIQAYEQELAKRWPQKKKEQKLKEQQQKEQELKELQLKEQLKREQQQKEQLLKEQLQKKQQKKEKKEQRQQQKEQQKKENKEQRQMEQQLKKQKLNEQHLKEQQQKEQEQKEQLQKVQQLKKQQQQKEQQKKKQLQKKEQQKKEQRQME